ncbi:metal-sulfur cluster assembly factor [Candidatus Woesearchaeota archaeon]|nr:metal-sulfur cluster assembly factor [Candidatus Woesearchaeota archaeon]
MGRLKKVNDPELGVSIVDLGLVYDVKIDNGMVVVKMTLTSPACPVGPLIIQSVEEAVRKVKQVKGVTVNIVWEPPWNTDKISEETKMELGIN